MLNLIHSVDVDEFQLLCLWFKAIMKQFQIEFFRNQEDTSTWTVNVLNGALVLWAAMGKEGMQ